MIDDCCVIVCVCVLILFVVVEMCLRCVMWLLVFDVVCGLKLLCMCIEIDVVFILIVCFFVCYVW